MNRQKYENYFNTPNSVIKNYSSSIYSILSHKNTDIEKIPLSPNSLIFKDKNLEKKYFQTIYCSPDSLKSPSIEFKSNLIVFYLYFSLFVIISSINDLMMYIEVSISFNQYMMKLSLLILTFVAGFSTLYIILRTQ